MSRTKLSVVLAAVLTLKYGIAVAEQPFHPAENEAGTIMHLMPGTKTGAQISSERRDADRSRDFADGWRYVGGDTGWELIQYAYTMKNGQLEHADSCVRIVSPRLPSDVIEKWRKMNQVEAPTS